MRKLFVFLLCITFSICAQAFSQKNNNGQFYMGMGAGALHTFADSQDELNDSSQASTFNNAGSSDIHDYSLIAHILAGYVFRFNHNYLAAIELSGDFSNRGIAYRFNFVGDSSGTDIPSCLNETYVKLNDFQFNLDVRPGLVVIPNASIFGVLGLAYTKINLTGCNGLGASEVNNNGDLGIMLATENGDTTTHKVTFSHDKSKLGVRLGLGFQENINQNIAIRLEYVYSYYGKVRMNSSETFTQPIILLAERTGAHYNRKVTEENGENGQSQEVTLLAKRKIRVSDGRALLSIVYTFPT